MNGRLLLDLDEAAASLSISRRSLQSILYRGELASVKIGRCRRIAVADLERYVADLRDEHAPPGGTESQPALAVVGGGRHETKAVRGR